MKKILISLVILSQLIVSPVMADEDDFVKNTQNDIILVATAGVGGAILGLSTLSFTNEPSKHISNVWTGAALGVIAGVIFVAFNSAQKNSEDLQSSASFSTFERVAWHHNSQENSANLGPKQVSSTLWSTEF